MKIRIRGLSHLSPIALLAAMPVEAYVGPGLGAGTLGVVLGLLGSILIALFAFFWYPIKRIFKKWITSGGDSVDDEEEEQAEAEVAEEKE
jgi:hypothetical protein